MSFKICCATGALNRFFRIFETPHLPFSHCSFNMQTSSKLQLNSSCRQTMLTSHCPWHLQHGAGESKNLSMGGGCSCDLLIVSGSGHWHQPILGVFGLIHWAAYRLTHIFSLKKAYGSDRFSCTTRQLVGQQVLTIICQHLFIAGWGSIISGVCATKHCVLQSGVVASHLYLLGG